jgi:indolepyruvate ferredoxin oxidoreductase alpha subunit
MGASISMASGASHAGVHPVLCVIGDSTFIHSGMTGLIGAIRENNDLTVVILDNGTVAMTGTQESMATGERLDQVILGLGVDPKHFRVINPLPKHHDANTQVFAEEIAHRGLSVVVARRACIQIIKTPKA